MATLYLKRPRWAARQHGVVRTTKYENGVVVEISEVDPYKVVHRESLKKTFEHLSEVDKVSFLKRLELMIGEEE